MHGFIAGETEDRRTKDLLRVIFTIDTRREQRNDMLRPARAFRKWRRAPDHAALSTTPDAPRANVMDCGRCDRWPE
ncbi:MAG: hypothetical protein ABIS68_11535 [Casimicrobiaceae bacterium]